MQILAATLEEFKELDEFNKKNLKYTENESVVISKDRHGIINVEDATLGRNIYAPLNFILSIRLRENTNGIEGLSDREVSIYGKINDEDVIYVKNCSSKEDLDIQSIYRNQKPEK